MRNGRRQLKWLLAGLLFASGFLLSSVVQAACSAYAGKVVFNELFKPAATGGEFVELRVLDPAVIAASTNFSGWKIDLYAGNNATKQTVDVASGFTNVATNSCGTTSLWLRFPSTALSFLQTHPFPYNFVLYDTTGGNKIIDILRAGTTATSYYGAGTTYGACSTIESMLPVTGTVDSQYDAIVSASGASDKDLFRSPDGTGPWVGASTSGTANTACGTNSGGGGTFGLAKTPSVTTVAAGTDFSYTLYATNGATAVTTPASVTVTDNLNAAGLTFVSCTTAAGTCTNNAGVVTWTVGAMGANTSRTATLTVRAAAAGTVTNSIVSNVGVPAVQVSSAPVIVTAPAGPDHVELVHDGAALTCTPKAITVLGCTTPASCNGVPANQYTAGSFSVSPSAIAGAAWCADSLCATTLANPATLNNGSVIYLKDTSVRTDRMGGSVSSAANTTLQCLNTASNTLNSTSACDVSFAASGFLVTLPNHVSCSNSTLTVQAVQSSNNAQVCVPMFRNATRVETMAFAYSTPATGTLVPSVGGTPLTGGSASVSLTFDNNGVARPAFVYQDVGRLMVAVTDPALPMTGSVQAVVAPASFAVGGPAAGTIKAGAAFSATVTAKNACAVATPNFGKEAVPESAMLSFTKCQPAGAGSSVGVFGGGVGAFTNGVAIATNLNWSEVGNGDLVATLASGSYLGSGLTASGNTGAGGVTCSAAGGAGNVGRFIPEHFDTAVLATVSSPIPCPAGMACPLQYNGFVYSGQPFSVRTMAKNLAGGTTVNYDGALGFAKDATLTAWNALGGATQNPGGGALANGAVAAVAFSAGVATLATPTYTLAAVPSVPVDIYLRATDVDSVTSWRTAPSVPVEGGVKVMSGRIRIASAHGSEFLPLPITATVQYYDGANWLLSATDSLSSFNTNLTTSGGDLVMSAVTGCAGGVTVSAPGAGVVAGGVRTFSLNPPGAANCTGLRLNAPVWLPSNTARATFGVYKGGNEFIYLRENY